MHGMAMSTRDSSRMASRSPRHAMAAAFVTARVEEIVRRTGGLTMRLSGGAAGETGEVEADAVVLAAGAWTNANSRRCARRRCVPVAGSCFAWRPVSAD
jgi:glycine/D-amino acid oxidase-like deaminating enzyme